MLVLWPELTEVTLTMTQMGGLGAYTANTNVPAGNTGLLPLRAMSLSTYNTANILDGVQLEYGLTGESIDYIQHTSRVNPFGRITVDAGKIGQLVAAYSDGGKPNILSRHDKQQNEIADDDELASANEWRRSHSGSFCAE